MRRPAAPTPADVPAPRPAPPATDEVVTICQDLLRIDTSNYGDDSGPGERKAAEHVAGLLDEVGLDVQLFERATGRTSVVTRVAGEDPSRPALLVHGHLDVVPAQAADWQVDPFSGEIRDDCLWGRGAVDMKDMDAILLSIVRERVRQGRKPPRDLVVAFLADEEAGGSYGAQWLVREHRDLFEGVSDAVSEVGGFSVDLLGRRTYLLQTAEKGLAWLKLTADGRAGHGSQINPENAVTRLAEAIGRIGAHRWPVEVPVSVKGFFTGVRDVTGRELITRAEDGTEGVDLDALTELFGTAARWLESTVRNTSNPTVLNAGYKHNVIPGAATALLDCRFLPGREEHLMETLRELAGPHVRFEVVHRDAAVESPFSGPLVSAMQRSLLEADAGATVLPYCLSAGTDNKSFAKIGINGYGFVPLQLPADLDFPGMFHGVDERVPLESLKFGVKVFDRFLDLS
ncbi:M20/M25/M40 family metallo-hydrolase [Spongisporangium articulatum]|uniref:M20/M25/M40 family metallo-hydrolase n=1 Tax=Spongisporangium articulatum TaxID=3362603 RepID=A0ABW8ARX9_9ACTN